MELNTQREEKAPCGVCVSPVGGWLSRCSSGPCRGKVGSSLESGLLCSCHGYCAPPRSPLHGTGDLGERERERETIRKKEGIVFHYPELWGLKFRFRGCFFQNGRHAHKRTAAGRLCYRTVADEVHAGLTRHLPAGCFYLPKVRISNKEIGVTKAGELDKNGYLHYVS